MSGAHDRRSIGKLCDKLKNPEKTIYPQILPNPILQVPSPYFIIVSQW